MRKNVKKNKQKKKDKFLNNFEQTVNFTTTKATSIIIFQSSN